ncbi:hypothetical protein V5R04_07175 [Jonesiaceae bacterium BS-20]|uniref:Uncharacterized protein n=1 Tax=Jonesiaceae bacterium BS-20 TaxID=3120821 RepID=A0AAU7DY91_9MICO
MWNMYMLTNLTGKKADAQRILPVGIFEGTKKQIRNFVITIVFFAISTAVVISLIGLPGILVSLALSAGFLALITYTSKGSGGRLWVFTQRDKWRSESGQFFIGGRRVDPLNIGVHILAINTVPVPKDVNSK